MSTGWRSSCELEKSAELWTTYNTTPENANHVHVHIFGSFETLSMKYVCLQLHKVIVHKVKTIIINPYAIFQNNFFSGRAMFIDMALQ